MPEPTRLARWDDFSAGHWGAAGARNHEKGSWGGINMVRARDGGMAVVAASRPLTFDNMEAGHIIGMHWAWGVDGQVYFVQEILEGDDAGEWQVRRFTPVYDGSSITIEDVGDPIPDVVRIPAWTSYSDRVYLSIYSDLTYEIDPTGPTMAKLTSGGQDVPGGRAITAYGERLLIGGIDDAAYGGDLGNRVVYSEPAAPENVPTGNFFDVGADRTEIGGLYTMSDLLVVVLQDQTIWGFRGTPGGASSLRKVFGFHAGSGGINTWAHTNGVVDPGQLRMWIFDHVSRGPARFNGSQFTRVPGFGISTGNRQSAENVDGVTVAHGGPDDVVIDRVPLARTDGVGAAGEKNVLVRVHGAFGVVSQDVLRGQEPR